MKTERRYQGIPVSPGIARATAFVYRPDEETPPLHPITESEVDTEIKRLDEALMLTRRQILELQERVAESVGANDASIFDAHLLVVEDDVLVEEIRKRIRLDLCNAEHAFHVVAHRYTKSFSELDDPYLRERAIDIHDVTRRVIHNLMGRHTGLLAGLSAPHVVIAQNLTPSDTAQMNRDFTLGFATELGGKTSHTAIMARSLNIPAIVGLHDISKDIENGAELLLDGYSGLLIVDPCKETLYKYGELQAEKTRVETELGELRESASTTKDGRHVILSANIELPDDVELVRKSGAEGVGLFRTEFLYINRPTLPTEEEQYIAYKTVSEGVKPHCVIFRTLDLGGDKLDDHLTRVDEENPFLGWRAIRLCLERKDIFKTQLRAILRASTDGNLKIMYPMISGLSELRKANEILDECRAELRSEGKPFDENIEVGMMIEVPSAALIADLFAREVKFFSLGTNDLVQYTLAVDRTNGHIAHLYEPTHPAVLRLIKHVVEAAHNNGIWTGVCGEMGGDILLTPLLIGLGVDELSAGSAAIPRVKRAVRSLDFQYCHNLAVEALRMDTPAAVLASCEEAARAHYPELL